MEIALGLGTSNAARLRGWYRRIVITEASNRRRLSHLKRTLSWPYRSWKESLVALRSFGPLVTQDPGIPTARQFMAQWVLALRTGLPPERYYALRLFLPERRNVARHFMLSTEMHVLFMKLAHLMDAEEAATLDDKETFDKWCRDHQLPVATICRVFLDGHVTEAGAFGHEDLFSKPKNDRWGRETAVWQWISPGRYRRADGGEVSEGEMVDELTQVSLNTPMLLQVRLHNHPDIRELSRGGLCTIRIVSSRPPGGRARAVAAAFGMPLGSGPASNFRYSVVAPVDLLSGELGPGILKETIKCTESYSHHPDTGAAIEGRALPFWRDAVSMVERAHDHVRSISSLGWDVAITESGPVLIEVNVSWGLDTIQMPSGIPVATTPFGDDYLQHMRRQWAQRSP